MALGSGAHSGIMMQPAFDPPGLSVPTINTDDHRGPSMTRRVIAALALAATLAAPVVAQSVARDSVASARQRASVTASPNEVRIRVTVTMVD